MAFANLREFTNFVAELINLIIKKGDTKAAELQAQLDKLSADLTVANSTIQQLQATLATTQESGAKALADLAAAQLADLDAVSTELAAQFNPTPVADAVSEAVAESPAIETPAPVVESAEVGTGEPTPPEVVESAVEAIVESVPTE